MNKTKENILLFPINLLVWISHNPSESFMIGVFGCSFIPLFTDLESPAVLGGLISFFSMVMAIIVMLRENKKEVSKLYTILCLIIMLLGVVALCVLGGKKENEYWSPFEKMMGLYMGALFGLIVGAMIQGFIQNQKEERRLEREEDVRRNNLKRSIPLKVGSNKIPIRDESGLNIIGYVEKEKYDEFISQNLTKDETQ